MCKPSADGFIHYSEQKIARTAQRASPFRQNSRLHYVKGMRIAPDYLLTGGRIKKRRSRDSSQEILMGKKSPRKAGEIVTWNYPHVELDAASQRKFERSGRFKRLTAPCRGSAATLPAFPAQRAPVPRIAAVDNPR